MTARFQDPNKLTPTEAEADKQRNLQSRCYKCVNGCYIFKRHVCSTNKKWPSCIDKPGGYKLKTEKGHLLK